MRRREARRRAQADGLHELRSHYSQGKIHSPKRRLPMFDFLKMQLSLAAPAALSPLFLMLQDEDSVTRYTTDFNPALMWVWLGIALPLTILVIAGIWKVFTKAGEPGWASIVPIYNAIVLLRIAGKPWWWLLLLFIPLVNVIIAILVSIEVANNFGKGGGFGLGLAFLGFIFYPILGFGSARYLPQRQQYSGGFGR
jgi:hypothetical protein